MRLQKIVSIVASISENAVVLDSDDESAWHEAVKNSKSKNEIPNNLSSVIKYMPYIF